MIDDRNTRKNEEKWIEDILRRPPNPFLHKIHIGPHILQTYTINETTPRSYKERLISVQQVAISVMRRTEQERTQNSSAYCI
jgi:hypothetical protein